LMSGLYKILDSSSGFFTGAEQNPTDYMFGIGLGAGLYFIGDRMEARRLKEEELELREEMNTYLCEMKKTGNHVEDTLDLIAQSGIPEYKSKETDLL
ncbi:hypothetical protein GOV10_05600, partial [Candidatus Woesearchaeota archaeon]|nr:hypothetical protein [Candidatus Woesearchaeota archaeon]